MILAISAVLISAASFYATYLQSIAAERQVKAETWPFLQVDHGNVDSETGERKVNFSIRNVGVGPARLETFDLSVDGQRADDFWSMMRSCCLKQSGTEIPDDQLLKMLGSSTTSTASPRIIPEGDKVLIFSLGENEHNGEAWSLLDKARWRIKTEACYCSILEECWQTDLVNSTVEVDACPASSNPDAYWR